MAAPDSLTFERAAARIRRILTAIALVGTCGALALGGWKVGAGFLLGAAVSGINYHWLRKTVASLGSASRPRYWTAILGFRYLILGGGAYAILRVSPIDPTAVLAGLFVLTAAVFVEVVFEIVYAGK